MYGDFPDPKSDVGRAVGLGCMSLVGWLIAGSALLVAFKTYDGYDFSQPAALALANLPIAQFVLSWVVFPNFFAVRLAVTASVRALRRRRFPDAPWLWETAFPGTRVRAMVHPGPWIMLFATGFIASLSNFYMTPADHPYVNIGHGGGGGGAGPSVFWEVVLWLVTAAMAVATAYVIGLRFWEGVGRLELSQVPVAPGGLLAGELVLFGRYRGDGSVGLVLECRRVWERNRSTAGADGSLAAPRRFDGDEEILGEVRGTTDAARLVRGVVRSRLPFELRLPEDLPGRSVESSPAVWWRLRACSEEPGHPVLETFDVPVFTPAPASDRRP